MGVWDAVLLGMFQGITEFLPISSSGHLVLLQKILGITEPVMVFDTAVHGGTLLAVIIVLRRDIWSILRHIVQPLTLYLIVATIPAVIVALLFKDWIEHAFSSGSFLGFAFLVTSVLLLISDMIYRGNRKPGGLPARLDGPAPIRTQDEMNLIDALFIGLLQAVAIVPGISRSGATISGALFRRLDRYFAARFSFLLSIPAILGALVLQIKDLAKTGVSGSGAIGASPIIVGCLVAAVIGFLSISLLLRIIRDHSLRGFALYTGILGLMVLVDQFATHLFF